MSSEFRKKEQAFESEQQKLSSELSTSRQSLLDE